VTPLRASRNRARRLALAPALAAVAVLATTGAAAAATPAGSTGATGADGASAPTAPNTSLSSNWAGYAVTGRGSHVRHFTYVAGSWVAPAVTCTPGQSTYSAFWVGIGGVRQTTRRLEQTGTEADCTRAGTARYSAWYELVPHASVRLRLAIAPGDLIRASVRISGARVTLEIVDRTTGARATKHLRFPHPDTTSAEWIAEAPSSCNGAGRCVALPLSDFGRVSFTDASVTTRRGQHGTIRGASWAAQAISLTELPGSGQTRTVLDPRSQVTAAPTVLTDGSTSFTVTWSAQSPPGPPPGPSA